MCNDEVTRCPHAAVAATTRATAAAKATTTLKHAAGKPAPKSQRTPSHAEKRAIARQAVKPPPTLRQLSALDRVMQAAAHRWAIDEQCTVARAIGMLRLGFQVAATRNTFMHLPYGVPTNQGAATSAATTTPLAMGPTTPDGLCSPMGEDQSQGATASAATTTPLAANPTTPDGLCGLTDEGEGRSTTSAVHAATGAGATATGAVAGGHRPTTTASGAESQVPQVTSGACIHPHVVGGVPTPEGRNATLTLGLPWSARLKAARSCCSWLLFRNSLVAQRRQRPGSQEVFNTNINVIKFHAFGQCPRPSPT